MTKDIYKAVFYGRVSTVNDAQETSIENQILLCESYISRHPEIVLAEPIDTYIEKRSAKSDMREKYIELMVRLSKGDIDYLIIKDLKRLSRSAEVSLQIRSSAEKYGYKLILLESGRIYDPLADESSRLLYGFESLLNEEVVHRQSLYGRIAHKQKVEAKRLNRQNETFAFRWSDEANDMIIKEDEAEVIRGLFENVLFKDMGVKELKLWLKGRGVYVCDNTIRNWLHETAYIGIFHINKKGSKLRVGAGQKTERFFNPKEEWVAVERPDLRILDVEIFDLVQRVLDSRKIIYDDKKYDHSKFHGLHLFSSKVFCKECGNPYVHCWSDRKKTISVYKESTRASRKRTNPDEMQKEKPSCINTNYKKVYEADLEKIALAAINGFVSEHEKCFETLLKAIESTLENGLRENPEQKRLEKKILKAEKDAEKILESYLETSGALKLALAEKYENIMHEIEELKSHRIVDVDEDQKREVLNRRIIEIQNHVGQMKQIEVLDRETVLHFIKRIEIDKEGTIDVYLNIDSMYQSQINAWQSRKQSQKKEAAFFVGKIKVFYVYNQDFYVDVVTDFIEGMMDLLAPAMETARRICCTDWKLWS